MRMNEFQIDVAPNAAGELARAERQWMREDARERRELRDLCRQELRQIRCARRWRRLAARARAARRWIDKWSWVPLGVFAACAIFYLGCMASAALLDWLNAGGWQ